MKTKIKVFMDTNFVTIRTNNTDTLVFHDNETDGCRGIIFNYPEIKLVSTFGYAGD